MGYKYPANKCFERVRGFFFSPRFARRVIAKTKHINEAVKTAKSERNRKPMMFLPPTSIPVAVSSEYGTGSEEDTLWVLASVAGGSAMPWKTEHLAASWTGSLPGCPGAHWPRATTARSPQTSTGQMAPSPTRDRPMRPDRRHLVQHGGGGCFGFLT